MIRSVSESRHRRAVPAWALIVSGIAVAFLVPVVLAHGAPPAAPLRMKIEPFIARPRSLGPTAIDVLVVCDSSQLFEGQFELTMYLGKETRTRVYEYRSGDMAISAGDHRLRVLIPPLPVPREPENLVIHARFAGKNGIFDFPDEYNVLLAGSHKRAFVLGISQPTTRKPSPDGLSFADRLPFEQFNHNPVARNDWLTYPAFLRPEDLPATSAGYFMFDVLVLEEDGLVDLKEPQLRAIADWVEAGGSLFVMITRAVQPRHRDFLNRLVQSNGTQDTFWTDERGALTTLGGEKAPRFLKSSPGLGRVAVVLQPIDRAEFFAATDWQDIVLWLWKARHDQSAAVRTKGNLAANPMQIQNGYYRPPAFSPVPLANSERLYERLIPSRVEGVPLSTVVTILVLFLLAVAPGDYLLLGFLRRRKYTWVLFTVVSLGFTLVTVRLAQSHMGRVDYRTHLTFVDFGNGTKAARSSRIEMVFTAAERLLETPTHDEVYLSLNQRRSAGPKDRNPLDFDPGFDEIPLQEDADLPVVEGRAPGSYLVRQQMRQWSPRFHRVTSCAPEIESPGLDWLRQPDESWETPAGRRKYHQRISGDLPGVILVLIRQKEVHVVTAAENGLLKDDETELVSLVVDISRRPEIGMFSVVSHISPTGADGFEDLSVVDPSNPGRDWALLIVPDGQSHTVYRKSMPTTP